MASRLLEVGVYCFFACYYQRTAARRNLLGRSYLTAHLDFVLNLNYCCEHRSSRVKVFQPTELLSSVYGDANLSRFPVALRVVVKSTRLNYLSKLHLRRLVWLSPFDFGSNLGPLLARASGKILALLFCFSRPEALSLIDLKCLKGVWARAIFTQSRLYVEKLPRQFKDARQEIVRSFPIQKILHSSYWKGCQYTSFGQQRSRKSLIFHQIPSITFYRRRAVKKVVSEFVR